MRWSTMMPVFLLLAVQLSLAGAPIDTAVAIRNTVLRLEPNRASEVVAELAADTEVAVFERRRLWVRLAAAGDADAVEGWLRFTELRFGGATARGGVPKTSGFAGFSRSVSGFLSSFRRRGRHTAQTSTIGIRGLTVADLEAARPDRNALAAITGYAISRADAEQFAGAGGLVARDVPYAGEL